MVLPFLMQGVVIVIGSQITDFLRRKRLITTTRIRKINSSISLLISGLCLVITGYVGGNHYAVIGLFTTSIAIVCLACKIMTGKIVSKLLLWNRIVIFLHCLWKAKSMVLTLLSTGQTFIRHC